MFSNGDTVRVKIDGKIGIIINKVLLGNTNQYLVFHSATEMNSYYEEQLELFNNTNVKITTKKEFLEYYAQMKMKLSSSNELFSLNSGKIKFIPFQFRPLSKILKSDFPRLLIADEVGVGKTIETGLIIKEFEKRENADSIIIICPKDLTFKWKREMKNKFDEHFEILTSERLSYCLKEFAIDGEWPINCRKCIANLEMIRNEKTIEMLESLEDSLHFDMLILDEAHHVINPSSNSHRVLEYFCNNSDIAVFLSATPLQLGSQDLFSLLNLLVPEEYMDFDMFEDMAAPNHFINETIRLIRNHNDKNWQRKSVETLSQIYVNDWAISRFKENSQLKYWLNRLGETKNPLTIEERISCLHDLEQLHTFSNIINRTKRKDIGEFTIREPITVMNTYNEVEREFYQNVREFKNKVLTLRYDSRTANFIMSAIERQITSCIPAFVKFLEGFINTGLNSLNELIDSIEYENDIKLEINDLRMDAENLLYYSKKLPEKDSKTEKLLRIINETIEKTDNKKLLVFSYFKNTLSYLKEQIAKEGIRVEVITGDTTDEEREEFRNRFRTDYDSPETIDVLLCSEVGCEGLDYEFCNRMVNYDIPWNPMKIEQRIGRIDRFGQKSPKVQIFNFITKDTVEEKIFFRCYERLGVFSSTVGDLEGVLGTLVKELNQKVINIDLTDEQEEMKVNQLADNAIRLANENRLFEIDAKDLLLLDVMNNEKNIRDEKQIQSKMLKTVVCEYLKSNHSSIQIEEHDNYKIKVKIPRKEKEAFLKEIVNMKRTRTIDRNSKECMEFENYLCSDKQFVEMNFNNDEDNNASETLISFTHPIVKLALIRKSELSQEFELSLTTHEQILPKGTYIFGCYKWVEKGYRENENIIPVVMNSDTYQEVEISRLDFEKLLLSSVDSSNRKTYDYKILEQKTYDKQLQEKRRLKAVNNDIINRKLATVNQYYQREINRIDNELLVAKNNKIRRMKESQMLRTRIKWETKVKELEEKFDSDIIVKKIAQGILEVR